MDEIQRVPITLEQRQAVFHDLAREIPVPVQMNTLMFLHGFVIFLPGFFAVSLAWNSILFYLMDWGVWRYVLATIAAVFAGIAGLFVGFWVGIYGIFGLLNRWEARRIKRSSDESLWKRVEQGLRNECSVTLALAQLAVRGQDVNRVLPRIIELLDSVRGVARCIAFDAFRFVYLDEVRAIGDYKPNASFTDCHAKVTRLRKLLETEMGLKMRLEAGEKDARSRNDLLGP